MKATIHMIFLLGDVERSLTPLERRYIYLKKKKEDLSPNNRYIIEKDKNMSHLICSRLLLHQYSHLKPIHVRAISIVVV